MKKLHKLLKPIKTHKTTCLPKLLPISPFYPTKPLLTLTSKIPYNHKPSLNNLSHFYSSFSTSKFSKGFVDNDETDDDLGWEDDDDSDPEIGDGGAGGGIVLQNVRWGEKVLSIAREILLQFGDDIKLYAFKTTPSGYIYVRLDKLTSEYGCPDFEEVESYNREYKKRLEEEGSKGLIPDDLAVEVSSPGANRLLTVPDDLHRFKEFAMVVSYVDKGDIQAEAQEKTGVFCLDVIETEKEQCIWKLADVKENRGSAGKGRPLNRKQRDWRLELPYSMLKKVGLHFDA